MLLDEFSKWLERKMRELDIPKNARVEWVDIGNTETKYLDIEYDRESNTVRIVDL